MPKRKISSGSTGRRSEHEQPKRQALHEEHGVSRLEQLHSPSTADEEDDLSMKWKKPTLIDTLKAILKDYPANEQILKELIQNAEDAGAKTIKFLYDEEEYPSDGLFEDKLAAFQGPALYAYNDAMFSDDDFKNLVSIQNSSKLVDRSKVGRFGRGFKSVFHMTELPCLLSGKYLGKIDPNVEDESLMHKHSKLLLTHPNELKPYLGKFNFTEATCKSGLYKGTIFRFPLRRVGCTYKVSDTVYTREKITNIFETLKTQASMNLLFLKSLESIEVFTREPSGEQQWKFCVSVKNVTDPRLQERGKFFKEIDTKLPKTERHLTYMIDINTLTGRPVEGTSQRFLVCYYYNSVNVSETFERMLRDKDLSNNPIVGVAMPLKDNASDHCLPVSEGHLFCFLPLPVDGKASPTGLPVHVNSFFAVDSKRSKIEWPTDQDGNLDLEDMPTELKWNHCLVTELLPVAYARLLQDATKDKHVRGDSIYQYFPSVKEVEEKWREILLPSFFRRALKMPLFPTVGGCNEASVMLDDAVICPPSLNEELRCVLVKLLVKAGKNVVCPPEHVMEAIKEYCSPVEATSCYVRSILKEHHCYKKLSRPEKLCLLKFLIEDSAFNDLSGLELLPAASGKFLVFCQTSNQVYIIDDERRKLLPTLEDLMLSTNLDSDLERKLRNSCGQTQLKVCSNEDCLELLSKVFPNSCSEEVTIDCCRRGIYSHLTQEWLKLLWQFLAKIDGDFPRSLEKVEELHILPICSRSELKLAKLSGNTAYVVQEHLRKTLSKEVSQLLQYFGIQVLSALPDYVLHHPQIFDGDYIYQPHPESVMRAIIKGTQVPKAQVSLMAEDFNTKTTMDQRKVFRGFLQPAVDSADRNFKGLLKQLKIFETIGRCGESGKGSASVVDIGVGVAGYDLPAKPSKDLLDLTSHDSQALAQVLGVRKLTETEILEEIIFDDIRKHLWSQADLEKVMKLVLQKLDVHSKSETFILRLKGLAFLMDNGGNLRKPEEMFDPEKEVLKKLFIGEDKFPGPAYSTCLVALQKLGLKIEADITGDDILSSASLIHEKINLKHTSPSTSELEKKSKTIAALFQRNPHLQSNAVIAKLCDIEWIPVQSKKPSSFPSTVHWEKPNKLFAKPKSVYSSAHVSVIGLSLPTVKAGAFPDEVIELLVNDHQIPLESIISHLGKVVKSYTASEKPAFMNMACDMYNAMKDFDGNVVVDELQRQKVVSWLWHGDGFTSADCLVIGQMSVANMHPYVYSLPPELLQFKNWLLHVGVREDLELAAVLEEIQLWHSDNPSTTDERVRGDEDLAVRIINKIAEQEVPDNVQGNILVPVKGGKGLTLLPAKECTYCDTKMDTSELSTLQKSFQEDEETIHYLHPAISKANATSLGVKSLDVGRLFDGSGFDFESEIEECGQHEPLTRRIARLLEENYRDGLVIPKELVQNADDAGATEIRFLFDERQNKEYCTGLLDDGMKIYQGPALWVYNNATFTDEDLANIRKLSGATKEEKRDKIGQFGLGFNAVYNITDVPSFVTREYIVFFDPHCTHLTKVLKNNDPGLKINLCLGTSRMALLKKRFADQFKPYDGIFNCSINETSEQKRYDGTLFRLPLRPPGAQSEFKSRQYSVSDVKDLLQGLVREANKLLLFTQNVKRIGIYHIPASGCEPSCPLRLFEAECRTLKMFKRLPIPGGSDDSPCGILKVADMLFKAETPPPKEPLHSSGMIETTSTIFPYKTCKGKDCFKLNGKSSNQWWLLFSCIGKKASLEFGRTLKSCSPVAGVAVKLHKTAREVYEPQGYPDGAPLFCHMPMPSTIKSGLPVIVNGSFALTSDRQHLLKQTTEDSTKLNICQWNEVLMKDAIVEAYLGTLEQATSFIDVNHCDPYCLWPVKETLDSSFQPFYECFYAEIATGQGRSPKILNSVKGWIDFGHAVFLDEALARSQLKELALNLVQNYLDSCGQGKCAVVLPEKIQQGFSNLKMETFTLLQFYELAFFPTIGKVENPDRDELVKLALIKCKQRDGLRQLVQSTACIAVIASSDKFLKLGELISPTGECGKLYGMEDERFPKNVFCEGEHFDVLKNLGMAVDEIPWEEVLQRAKSVHGLQAQSRSSRVSALLAYIERKLHKSEPDSDISTKLKEINFLPILQKPPSCPLSWKGDDLEHGTVVPANCLYAQRHCQLIGNLYLILDEEQCGVQRKHNRKTFRLLGLDQKLPSLSDVMRTVDELSRQVVGSQNKDIETYSQKVYTYLDEYCNSDCRIEEVKNLLRGKRCVLVQNHFMEPENIASNCDKKLRAPPYLSCVPHAILWLKNLLKALGIRDEFNSGDYIDALHRIKAENLTEDKIDIVRDIAECLSRCLHREQLAETRPTPATPEKPILLPADIRGHSKRNNQLLLLPVGQMCLRKNLKPWLTISDQNLKYVHPAIPHKTAVDLGVKSDCESIVASLGHGFGQPFGQKEKLTTRIKGILQGYPCDEGVLKELLQNADDAGATELKFLLDHEGQNGDEVMSEAWAELQGPALCVHNNKPFTKKDLDGICNLGLGSKNTDPTKTGQYGIGFNSVYHLTDVPSFFTDGEEIGRTVGIFDPNCRFIPGETTENPGRCFQREDLAKATASFPGSFSGYLDDRFPVEGATTFRLPLRTKESAEKSEISSKPVTFKDIESFFSKLQKEAFQCLLFVNSVRNISFLNTRTKKTYWVRVTISPADELKLAVFIKHMKRVSADLKKDQMALKDVAYQDVVYTLTFEDSKKRKEEWSVCQCIGFKDGNIPHDVQAAYKNADLSLLPRGGAAFCKNQPSWSKHGHKMFCFLPLPLPQDTNLPFHINGHFALDANRRGLWGPSEHCYRTAWNKLIIEECIAKACMSLVNIECDHLKKKMCPSPADLKTLYSLFPQDMGSQKEGYEKHLTSAFYREMAFAESACLVAVTMRDQTTEFEGRWFTVKDCIAGNVVFDKPDSEPKMEHDRQWRQELNRPFSSTSLKLTVAKTLSRLGYNILEAVPQFIFKALRVVGEDVQQVSRDHILKFMRQWETHPESTLKNLPQHISESPFMNISNLVKIIKYCLPQDCSLPRDCSLPLSGLPLCLTNDDVLRVFDTGHPVFPPTFSMLIPERADLFVKSDIYDVVVGQVSNDKSVKQFSIHDLALLIRERQEYQHFLQERPLELDISGEEGERLGSWLQNVWKLIKRELGTNISNPSLLQIALHPIRDFCFIPAYIEPASRYVLYRVEHAKQVVHPTDRQSAYFIYFRDTCILPLLKKLGVPMLELTLCTEEDAIHRTNMYMNKEIANEIVSHQEDGVGILNALWHLHQQGLLQVTCKKDANLLLEYFSNYFHENVRNVPSDRRLAPSQLLALPIHITVNGSIVSLEGCTVFLIPRGIPKAGLDNCFADRTNKREQFIYKGNKKLVAMYEDCGCCNKNEVEIYVDLLLLEISFCKFLTEAERLEHLKFIADDILPRLDQQSNKYGALIAALQRLPFVTDCEEQLQRAEKLYNPKVLLYAKMEKEFPSEEFLSAKLLDLLKKCGLKSTVTADELLKYAEMVETQAEPTDETVKKSKLIFEELEVMAPEPTKDQLFKMKVIRFIPVEKCASELTNLHTQHLLLPGSAGAFTCFQDSMLYEECDKCWTVAAILPTWIKASNNVTDLLRKLGVHHPVPVKTVVAHCTRLSQHLFSSNMAQKSSEDVMKYMTVLYNYFKESKDSLKESDYKELGNAPCITVDEGQSLIHPCQVCPELPSDLEMKPYLYKLPRDLGPYYDHLFRQLGVREQPDFRHYMAVLKVIHGECEGGEPVLDCNQEKSAKEAIKYFMQRMQRMQNEDDPSLEPNDSLYLLSRKKTLERSTDMVLVDDPRLLPDKAKEVDCWQVVGDIPDYTVHHLQRLPECIRPRLLSNLIEEVLDESITCVAVQTVDSGAVSCFRVRLKSSPFLDGLKRLLHHDGTSRGEKMEVFDDCWSKLQKKLTNIKFFTVPKIVTLLCKRGTCDILPNSTQESSKVFINMTGGCKVYIQQNEEEIMLNSVRERIAEYISTMMRIEGATALTLVKILSCPLDLISDTLDDSRITRYGEGTASCEPELGSFIPLVQHCLLKPDFVVFVVGEIVGFEREDPLNDGKNGAATYMYAKIIHQIRSDNDKEEMGFKYEIDIGDSTLIVPASDLYKFTRKRSESLQDKLFNLAEEKKKITADLKYAFHSNSLNEDEQKKFLKRLIMKWQMEANEELLQFIEDEVGNLQRELKDENKAKGSTSESHYRWFSSGYIFKYARERAQKHRTHIETLSQQESSASSDPLDFSYLRHRGKNPQPGEAKRWFRQAKADLAASKADDTCNYGTEKAYEWALQKCHQAAEKGLKAAGYTLDSKRLISHNLPLIASSLSNGKISQLALSISGKISDGMSLRYPDRLSYPRIPHDSYDENTYRQVFEWTNELLNIIDDNFRLVMIETNRRESL